MANPRHAHEHKVFRQNPLPPQMLLIAGVIDTKTNYIEHPEVVSDRILLAVQAVGDPTRVLAGTDCGFATTAGADRVYPPVVWEKLKSLREGPPWLAKNCPGSNILLLHRKEYSHGMPLYDLITVIIGPYICSYTA
jgi:5-methyltetrahydropteroyltriglutamate--homocysteine methyltransferase